MTKRKHILQDDETSVLVQSGRRCCVCFGLFQDEAIQRGQIAHLDQNPANRALDNLAFLCLPHHDEYDSSTRQSKGLTSAEVKHYREQLYTFIERLHQSNQHGFEYGLQVIESSFHIVEEDFFSRLMSTRETLKTERGLKYVYGKITKLLDLGLTPRTDGFFDQHEDARSTSDEILEGVLFKCRVEHEEKKIRYISNIYAYTAFHAEVSPEMANFLLQFAQEMTYRQMCVLAIIGQSESRTPSWGPKDGDPAFEMEYKRLEAMWQRGFNAETRKHHQETGEAVPIVGLSRIGDLCYKAMNLTEIPLDELVKLKKFFPHAFSE
jgi:hypothetical protein